MRAGLRRIGLLALVAFAGVAAALGADWGHYANARFGYGVDVPPAFVGEGESDNGDGQVFSTPTATLRVYGGNILDADFEAQVAESQKAATANGWKLSYQVSTPSKASFSGKRGGRVLYARMIALCGGTAFGMFELEYPAADLATFDPVVTRLVRSLAADGACL